MIVLHHDDLPVRFWYYVSLCSVAAWCVAIAGAYYLMTSLPARKQAAVEFTAEDLDAWNTSKRAELASKGIASLPQIDAATCNKASASSR
jgi:hypothetical protein